MEFYKTKIGVSLAGGLILLLGFCLLLAGCESDSVAPNEQLPALTEKGAAQQAALVAVGISKAAPELLKFSGKKPRDKDLGIYTYDFPEGGDISGSIMLEYFDGGPEGDHSTWNDADYGLLYTTGGEVVSVELELEGAEPVFGLKFDLHGDIDHPTDTAAVAGTGSFTTGASSNSFMIEDSDPVILHSVSTYPEEGGSFFYSADEFDLIVVYNGDDTALVAHASAPEVAIYIIDLDTGILTVIEI